MPYGNVNVDTVTTSTAGGILGAGNASIMKNRIINGAMVISQYNGTSSITPSSDTYVIDRYKYQASQASKFTFQQNAGSVTPPVGFSNYLGATVASAVSVGASDYFHILQKVEGFNFADCNWGTANAKTVTLSFQAYSSLTGTFGGVLQNSAQNRSYPFTYSIPVANTWTTISVTVAGDTSGTWIGATNGVGVQIYFNLGAGSTFSGTAGSWASANYLSATGATSVVGTSGATFYITGVQLEVGSSATGFEYRLYNQELSACQRYCINYKSSDGGSYMRYGSGYANSTTNLEINVHFPVQMRTTPSLTVTATPSNYVAYMSGGVNVCNSGPAIDSNSKNPLVSTVNASSASAFSGSGGGSIISNNNTTSYMLFTAEL